MRFRLSRCAELSLVGLTLLLSVVCPTMAEETGPIKLGVLTDMSSLYADNGGQGSVVAAQMAVSDFGGRFSDGPLKLYLGTIRTRLTLELRSRADGWRKSTSRWFSTSRTQRLLWPFRGLRARRERYFSRPARRRRG